MSSTTIILLRALRVNFIFNWKSDLILVLFIKESVFLFFFFITLYKHDFWKHQEEKLSFTDFPISLNL